MEKLRLKRLQKRLSQWDLSKMTGIHQSRISLIERNYVIPRHDEVMKLAAALKTKK
jgi:transcriptional regulator with XRE-family HTH domain